MSGHRFPGGLRLDPRKLAASSPLRALPLPPHLFVPLLQHAGTPARPCVAVGDRVRKGQRIGKAVEVPSAHVHAPASGHVRAITLRDIGHVSGRTLPCIEIESDGLDEWQRLPPLPQWSALPRQALHARLGDAGVVGLGGGVFPADLKFAGDGTGIGTLILNGAECEPYIACDEALMRERAHEVLAGALLLAHLCGAQRTVIAIEDRLQEALASLQAARDVDAALGSVDIETVPTRYPQGGERQLVRAITGIELAAGVLPRARGVLCVNVATAAAAHRAVVHGEALVSRIVSITGRGVATPCNLEVPLGTPVSTLVEAAGGYTADAQRLVIGGPMMGHAVASDAIPVGKGSNCVLVLAADDVRASGPEMPCIRCGQCADACPARLLPQQLHFHIGGNEWAKVRALGLPDCIECGLCAYVCPSHIPLLEAFRYGKGELGWQLREAERAKLSKARFERREARLAQAAQAREARLRARESGALPSADAALRAIPADVHATANTPGTLTPVPSAAIANGAANGDPHAIADASPVDAVEAAAPAAPAPASRPTDAVVAAAIAAARARASRTDADSP